MSPYDVTNRPLARKLLGVLLLLGIFAAGFAAGSGVNTTAQVNPNTRPPVEAEEEFAAFWETYNLITKIYLEPVDRQKLVDGAINGLVESLEDEFSGYVEPELNETDSDLSGSISGIGASRMQ